MCRGLGCLPQNMLWRVTERQRWLLYFQEVRNWVLMFLYLIRMYKLAEHPLFLLCLFLSQGRFHMCPSRVVMDVVHEGDIAPRGTPAPAAPPQGASSNTCCPHCFSNRKTHHGAQCFLSLASSQGSLHMGINNLWKLKFENKITFESRGVRKAGQGSGCLLFKQSVSFFFFSLCCFSAFYPFFESNCFLDCKLTMLLFRLDWIFTASHKPLEIGFIMETLIKA